MCLRLLFGLVVEFVCLRLIFALVVELCCYFVEVFGIFGCAFDLWLNL